MGTYPVVVVPDMRKFYVNSALLLQVDGGQQLLDRLKQYHDVVIVKHWPKQQGKRPVF